MQEQGIQDLVSHRGHESLHQVFGDRSAGSASGGADEEGPVLRQWGHQVDGQVGISNGAVPFDHHGIRPVLHEVRIEEAHGIAEAGGEAVEDRVQSSGLPIPPEFGMVLGAGLLRFPKAVPLHAPSAQKRFRECCDQAFDEACLADPRKAGDLEDGAGDQWWDLWPLRSRLRSYPAVPIHSPIERLRILAWSSGSRAWLAGSGGRWP